MDTPIEGVRFGRRCAQLGTPMSARPRGTCPERPTTTGRSPQQHGRLTRTISALGAAHPDPPAHTPLARVAMAWGFVVAASALLLPRAPAPRRAARLAMCAEPTVAFDAALGALLNDAEASGSLDGAVDRALGTLDEGFIPQLAATISSASPADPRMPRLAALMEVLQRRSLGQFDRAREQLQELLGAGEITKMDAALCKLVRDGEADAGLFYVLFRNMEDARKEGDNTTEKLL